MIVYGIPNCDTMKKARKWLDNHGIDYRFHDYRKDGIDKALLEKWIAKLGWEQLINRRGTTWRKLQEDIRENMNSRSAIKVMLENPAIIKRPVLVNGSNIIVGFKESEYQASFRLERRHAEAYVQVSGVEVRGFEQLHLADAEFAVAARCAIPQINL